MERVHINLGESSYWINIKEGIIENLTEYIGNADQWIIITDENVHNLYFHKLEEALRGEDFIKFIIPSGEASKNFEMAMEILSFMVEKNLTRKSKVIAFGGGVVGDIAGFCASIYMRGIDFIQIPTTLLAQVDSSVGGKTAINLPQGKNLVGTFYQPKSVLIYTDILNTLPTKQLLSGIGEVIKYGVIHDYSFLQYIKRNLSKIKALDTTSITYVIKTCCEIKSEIVCLDEKELGFRKILNFGHTVGHGLETITDYKVYTHGEAVLIGMYIEAKLSMLLELISIEYFNEIIDVITDCYDNVKLDNICLEKLIDSMVKDKKNQNGKISFVLPTAKSKVTEVLLSIEETKKLLTELIGGQ
ncbi:3-dehydroquinate synthase [Alkaliphilus peptidifermentans]|uniref:3-dehydroquinate synthase n=1 Tax=Alkaliphilus peptidifermentans DSM 18978 TaxID=1120976 RepID=A0A1G5D9Q4_9FIRM|nr:3-dehydroquinate synthase [Alkaliphilus peptidifermentans]SCY11549.1 3-dehydroquinate synthase [Alkaliphilus peptidifermentans DSM 18978]